MMLFKLRKRCLLINFLIFLVLLCGITLNNNFTIKKADNDAYIEDLFDLDTTHTAAWTPDFIHIKNNWSAAKSAFAYVQGGDGSEGSPYVIENVIIDASSSPTGSGIYIEDSDDYFIIRNCEIINAYTDLEDGGIKLDNVKNGQVVNNNCSENGENGIILTNNCENNLISDNIANDNAVTGIKLYSICPDNEIIGNTVRNKHSIAQDYGIHIEDSNFSTIEDNAAYDNVQYGIYLENGDNNTVVGNLVTNEDTNDQDSGIILLTGSNGNNITRNIITEQSLYAIYLASSDFNTISENVLHSNTQQGIRLSTNSDNNIISGNLVYNNDDYGIFTSGGTGNLIFYNSITDSMGAEGNGRDNSVGSIWNNTELGNYWSDYSGSDTDGNGIGDTPHDISGTANNKDYLPLMNIVPFFLKSPSDANYEIGTIGHYLNWTIIDASPFVQSYDILRDGIIVQSETVSSRLKDIALSIDGLSEDMYTYTMQATDAAGKISSDVVYVTITNTAPVFTATPSDLSYEEGKTGSNLSWIFSDISIKNPTYTLSKNGIPYIIDNSCISGEYINISVDGLAIGYYTFTIEVDDGYGSTVSDVVFVNVSAPESEEEPAPDLLAMIMNFLNEYSVILIPAIIGISIIIAAIIISRSMRKRPIETIPASTKEISKSKQVKKTKNDSKPKDTEEDEGKKAKKKSNK